MIGRRNFIGGALGLLTARLVGSVTGASREAEQSEPPFVVREPKGEVIEVTDAKLFVEGEEIAQLRDGTLHIHEIAEAFDVPTHVLEQYTISPTFEMEEVSKEAMDAVIKKLTERMDADWNRAFRVGRGDGTVGRAT